MDGTDNNLLWFYVPGAPHQRFVVLLPVEEQEEQKEDQEASKDELPRPRRR